ncbi:MAG TPA: ribonuclease D, partial [Povalibacter sp.]|nr:ribonuclease D [Povalibacter sp.]
ITTSGELTRALELLSGSDFVVIDTEFMRERTYYATLCLVQAATPDACVIIDPQAVPDLQPLWRFLADRRRLKVLHSARQDLEVLSQAMSHGLADANPAGTSLIPGPVFDTQIAAALLGAPAQVGYATLVAERLGHTLPKGQTRTDWSRRPLSAEQLAYAADDVRYLVPLYLELRAALEARNRLSWLQEEAQELEDPTLYRIEPADAWRRLKGLERLKPQQRATAKLLAAWRESRAMIKDKPRGWILADEALRDIADCLPGDAEQLEQIRGLSPGFLRKRSDDILALVAQGKANAATESPAVVPPRPDPQQLGRVSKLLAIVRDEAARNEIAPELLATRRDAEQLVFAGRSDHLLQGWRRALIGERLVAAASSQP